MFDWLIENIRPLDIHWTAMYWAALIFSLTCGASLALLGFLLVRLPAGHFNEPAEPNRQFKQSEMPWAVRLLKNLIGSALAVLGGIMALPGIPGPGLLILLLGMMMADFRGKRRFERWLVGRPGVLVTINKVRRYFEKAPMFLDAPQSGSIADATAPRIPSFDAALPDRIQD